MRRTIFKKFSSEGQIPRIIFFGGDHVSVHVLKHLQAKIDTLFYRTMARSKSTNEAAKAIFTPLAYETFRKNNDATNGLLPPSASCIEVVCPPHRYIAPKEGEAITPSGQSVGEAGTHTRRRQPKPGAPSYHYHKAPVYHHCITQGPLQVHEVMHPKSIKKANFVLPHRREGGEVEERSADFDVALVVSFRYFISNAVLNDLGAPCINLHPSLLPRYRGASPIYTTLRRNEKEGGASVIKIVPSEKMDCGDILMQKRFPLAPLDDIRNYMPRVLDVGTNLLDEVLFTQKFHQYWNDAAVQPDKPATKMQDDPFHAPLLKKEDSGLYWSTMSGHQCFGTFRAFAGGTHKFGQPAPYSVLDKGNTPVGEQLMERHLLRLSRETKRAEENARTTVSDEHQQQQQSDQQTPQPATSQPLPHARHLKKKGSLIGSTEAELRESLKTRCNFNEAMPFELLSEAVQKELAAVAVSGDDSFGSVFFPAADDSVCCVLCKHTGGVDIGGDGVKWFAWKSMTLSNRKPQLANMLRTSLAMKRGVLYKNVFVDPPPAQVVQT